MLIPFSWLERLIDLNGLPEAKICELLNAHSFEVEGPKRTDSPVTGPLVAARILSLRPHPNAEKLNLVTLETATSQALPEIVCGAKNIAVGQIVPLALPGACVLDRRTGKTFTIAESVIRGLPSAGMLCAASELGLSSDGEGIVQLPLDLPLETPLLEYLGLVGVSCFEVGVLSNRGDSMSVLGIARELSAILDRPILKPASDLVAFSAELAKLPALPISILAPESCQRLLSIQYDKVTVAPSPAWLSRLLEGAGIASINNIVDIGNYLMLELGQPMHAFAADKLDLSSGLQCRFAQEGEKLLALNGKEYDLKPENLVIADSKKALSVAGVIGGEESKILADSTSVIFELALFKPETIRLSSRKLGFGSDSSRRFERGVDVGALESVLARLNQLMSELAGAKPVAFGEAEGEAWGSLALPVKFSLTEYTKLLGQSIEPEQARKYLERLGCAPVSAGLEGFHCSIPSFRTRDLTRPIDLYEEIARLSGLNNFPSLALQVNTPRKIEASGHLSLKKLLVSQGFQEVIGSSLRPKNGETSTFTPIRTLNPVSSEAEELRTSLLDCLLESASYNFNRGAKSIRFFELGRIYTQKNHKPTETEKLAIIISVRDPVKSWQGVDSFAGDFYDLKGSLESLSVLLACALVFSSGSVESALSLHPNYTQTINTAEGKSLGFLGKIDPRYAKELGLPEETYLAELELPPLTAKTLLKKLDTYQRSSIQREITIDLLPSSPLNQAQIFELLGQNHTQKILSKVLINQYVSQTGSVALSYRLELEAATNEEANDLIAQIKADLTAQLPTLQLRGDQLEAKQPA